MPNSKLRIQVRCRNTGRMKAQSSIHEMWRRNSNDSWWTLNALNESLTGMPFIVGHSEHTNGKDSEALSALRKTLGALEKAVQFINLVLSLQGGGESVFEDDHQALEALLESREWIEGQRDCAHNKFTFNAISEIISHAHRYLKDENDLCSFNSVPLWEPLEAVDQFDVFISYRHREYVLEAASILTALKNLGLSVWIDREQLMLPGHVRREEIATRLVYAIKKSRVMVFFETYNEAIANEDHRGRRTVFNWQVLEQRYGTNLIVIRPERRTYSNSSGEFGYADDSDLANKIAAIVATRRGGDGRLNEPNFTECFANLMKFSEEYFGTPLRFSPQAAAALLAPEPPGDRNVVLGDDVLAALIRLSPRSALALSTAGVDCVSTLLAGPDLSHLRWSEPGKFRFPDVFGHDEAFEDLILGEMDETGLLLGILAYGAKGGTVSDLIQRAQRLSIGQFAEPADHSASGDGLRVICERVRELTAADARSPARDQQWEIWRDGSRWRIRPCASVGVWRLFDPFTSGTAQLTSLVVRQSEILYRRDEIGALEDFINAKDASGLELFLQRHPHLKMALSVHESEISDAIDITPDFPRIDRISLHPIQDGNGQLLRDEERVANWILTRISSAADVLSQPRGQTRQLGPFSLRNRPTLIFGAPPRHVETSSEYQALTFSEMAISILPSLWHYLRFRDVDPAFLDLEP